MTDSKKEEKQVQKKLIPLTEWSKHHSWPPLGGLRHLVFNSKKNGFDRVIKRVGKKLLLDEAAFFDWVEQHNTDNKEG